MTNKREFFRLKCPHYLCADFSLIGVKGKHVTTKSTTQIIIEDIGVGGIRFFSDLDLPVNDDVLYRLKTTIFNEEIVMTGRIRWKKEVYLNLYQYGIKFSRQEQKQNKLIKLLNQMAIYLHKQQIPPNSRFYDPKQPDSDQCELLINKVDSLIINNK